VAREEALQRVLLATDGSAEAELAERAAADLARRTGAELYLVHAWQYVPHPVVVDYEEYETQARQTLEDAGRRIEESGVGVAGKRLLSGPPVDEILDAAEEAEARLVVVGSRGLGALRGLLLGSVSAGVVHHSRVPVLVVRGDWPPERVIIGEDGSEPAARAGALAAHICRLYDAKAHLLRVFPELPEVDAEGRAFDARRVDDELRREERKLAGRAEELEEIAGRRPVPALAVGRPAEELLERAGESGAPERTLLAAGSRGLTAMRRLRLGSTSTRLLHTARGPLLICPPARED
jgi:nucleotide-binding universal stress UspA family protein